MNTRPPRSLGRRLGRAMLRQFGWLVGAPLAIFRFLSRQTPIEEIEPGGPPPTLPSGEAAREEREEGRGAVMHRLFGATIESPLLSAERLIEVIATDLNVIAPTEVLRFEKARGGHGPLEEGDELLIRMAGPWNASVRVTHRSSEEIRLAPTGAHPQRGRVDLRARDQDGRIEMEVRTRERAAGLGFQILRRIGLARRMQTYTWAEMLENAAQLAGGRRPERITMRTWREEEAGAAARRGLPVEEHSGDAGTTGDQDEST